jgi:hypothetical protein
VPLLASLLAPLPPTLCPLLGCLVGVVVLLHRHHVVAAAPGTLAADVDRSHVVGAGGGVGQDQPDDGHGQHCDDEDGDGPADPPHGDRRYEAVVNLG